MTTASTYEDMLSSVQKDLFLILDQWKAHFSTGSSVLAGC